MSRIGHFEIQRLLGSGGTGQVHIAVDTVIGREVAIKSLRPELTKDSGFLERFRAEAASLARLNHPNICTLFTVLPEAGNLYMVMELVVGSTLESLLQRRQTGLSLAESLAIVAQIGEGLSYAHRMGVIHRDLKPSNVMITDDGRVKIMDFGIARVQGSQRLTRDGSMVGTLAYIAPEQVKGAEGSEQSDIYSLAILLYEMLTGAPPFTASTDYDLIQAHINTKPQRLLSRVQGLSKGTEAAIMRALSKAPEDRFDSVRAFMQAIGAGNSDSMALVSHVARADAAGAGAGLPLAVIPAREMHTAPSGRMRAVMPLIWGLGVGTAGATAISAVLLGLIPLDIGFLSPPVKEAPRPPDIAQSRPRPILAPLPAPTPPVTPPGPSRTELQAAMRSAYDRQNYGEAFQTAQRLAELRDANGYRMLGALYQLGRGTVQNFALSELNYRLGAEAGDVKSQINLGNLFYEGSGQSFKDYGKARYWFEKAAEQNDPQAMYFIGLFYEMGYGVAIDSPQANSWYRKSASFGYKPAEEKLASSR